MTRRIAVLAFEGGIGRAGVAMLTDDGDDVLVLDLQSSLDRHRPDCPSIAVDVHSKLRQTARSAN